MANLLNIRIVKAINQVFYLGFFTDFVDNLIVNIGVKNETVGNIKAVFFQQN